MEGAPSSNHTAAREAVWSFKVDRLEYQIDTYWRQRVLAVIINQIRPPIIVQNRRNKQSFDIYAFTFDIVPLVLEKTCFAGQIFEYKWKMIKMRKRESIMQILHQRSKQRPTPMKNMGRAPTWEGPRPTQEPTTRRRSQGCPTRVRVHQGCGRTPGATT